MESRLTFKRNIGLFMASIIGIDAKMGLITLSKSLNYIKLGSALPIAGGGYSFPRMTLSRPVSFFTGNS